MSEVEHVLMIPIGDGSDNYQRWNTTNFAPTNPSATVTLVPTRNWSVGVIDMESIESSIAGPVVSTHRGVTFMPLTKAGVRKIKDVSGEWGVAEPDFDTITDFAHDIGFTDQKANGNPSPQIGDYVVVRFEIRNVNGDEIADSLTAEVPISIPWLDFTPPVINPSTGLPEDTNWDDGNMTFDTDLIDGGSGTTVGVVGICSAETDDPFVSLGPGIGGHDGSFVVQLANLVYTTTPVIEDTTGATPPFRPNTGMKGSHRSNVVRYQRPR